MNRETKFEDQPHCLDPFENSCNGVYRGIVARAAQELNLKS